MQNITRIALGLGAAAVVASGGSAFTASNTTTAVASDKLGYGEVTVTGVTVTNVQYVTGTTAGQLSSIDFTVDAAVPLGHQAKVRTTRADGTGAVEATCTTPTATTASTTTILCPISVAVADVVKVQFTVTTTA